MTLTWHRHFQRNGGLNQILRRQTSRFHYGSKLVLVMDILVTIPKVQPKQLPITSSDGEQVMLSR
jgi:hypothetical protein